MDFMYLIVGIIIGFVLAWFVKKSQAASAPNNEDVNVLRAQLQQATNESSGLRSAKEITQAENSKLNEQLLAKQAELLKISNELTAANSQVQHVEERLNEQKTELVNLREQFTKEFENLANRIFEEKSKKFTDQNKINLDELLKPLGEKIKDFEKKVNDVYVEEGKERASLKEQLTMLHQLNQQMSKEANNLTKALKGETKTQGNWGEIILENVLEKSGLVKDREYVVQMSLVTEEGKRYQPDIVVNLPDGKHLVIDSKVSLNAYERFSSAETDDERQAALKEHVISVRKHIKELSDKNYQTLYELKTLDFVLLFIPIEPAFAMAVQGDMQLFNDAFDKNIVIVSPSTMLATLRTVASIWRHENQNRNAIEIARQGGALYDKFTGFVDDLIALGNKMRDSQKVYEAAMNKLSSGSGNLVKRTEDLKKLGAKTTKNLPTALLERSGDEINE
jgi:DNA recombination protein RmuC